MGYDERLKEFLEHPQIVDMICDHVTQGGSLVELARAQDLKYADIMRYMEQDEGRSKRLLQATIARTEYYIEDLKQQLKSFTGIDIREIYTEDGCIKQPMEWSDELGQSVSSLEVQELFDKNGKLKGYTKKVRFLDKLKSIELIDKSLAMFIDKKEIHASKSLEDLLAQSYVDKKNDK